MKTETRSVTITIPKQQTVNIVKVGDRVKLGKNSWWMSRQRIKTKQMIHRLLRKEYYPLLLVTNVYNGNGAVTMNVKPYNF